MLLYMVVIPLRKRDHCVGVCIGHASGMNRGTHQVITLSVRLQPSGQISFINRRVFHRARYEQS